MSESLPSTSTAYTAKPDVTKVRDNFSAGAPKFDVEEDHVETSVKELHTTQNTSALDGIKDRNTRLTLEKLMVEDGFSYKAWAGT